MWRRTVLWSTGGILAGLSGCVSVTPDGQASPRRSPDGSPPTGGPPTGPTPDRPPTGGGSGDGTERPGDGPTPTPSAFQLVAVDIPSSVQLGEPLQYRFTVENTRQQVATFETTVSRRVDRGAWTVTEDWGPIRVAAGERHTVESTPITRDYLGTLEFRIDAFDEVVPVVIEPVRMSFEEAYRDPRGLEVTVRGIGTRLSYSYTTSEGRRRVEAAEDMQWVFVTVSLRNSLRRAQRSPSPETFTLLADDRPFAPRTIRSDGLYEEQLLGNREEVRGWVVFEAPREYAAEQYRVRWQDRLEQGEIGAVWRASA